ncbi:OmpA family protein [Mucilaginibacter sp.]|uniref:OmpA family protein n=1 Tax=Mucilaginibacter sp. TaxID=1882438 RepID=UPI0025E2755A|nr:OmpA family protein [Mucilaginibacter sp.]
MNYSTLKKTVVLSCVSLMAVGIASAQTDSTKKMSDAAGPAKLFGGAGQYNTWSIGVNVGVTGSSVITGGFNRFNQSQPALGFGVSVKDQLSHAFGIQLDAHAGQIKGRQDQSPNANDPGATTTVTDLVTGTQYEGFKTNFISGSLSGVVNFGNISFLHRANSVNFYASAGFGFMVYDPAPSTDLTNYVKWSAASGHKVKEVYVPVGVGVKFRASDHLDFNVGYTENFVDGFNVTGVHAKYPSNDKYSYGYVGLEYTLGSSSKPSLEWANPVAMMYDELYDAALRAEVEALKGRVTNVENAVNDLKKDSDGDGVADQFDKCPNTPAGSVVDGSGCPIKFPEPVAVATAAPTATPYGNIQFEFDSSVLKTSSYPVLDATSADMRANSSTVTLAGYASSEGTAAHNMRLSKDRANSVKTYLVNSGVDAKRLKVKGFGETHPIADNSTEDGRVANRRVEMHK